MPLFQPSNITPSSFAGIGGGTVAANDSVNISWQVNGNVPMTGFKIDIYSGDNRVGGTDDIIVPSSRVYPTDGKGNPTYYMYKPSGKIWSDLGVSDGKSYTMQITQYWTTSAQNDSYVQQTSQTAFISRTRPTLAIKTLIGGDITSPLNAVSQSLSAVYQQAQGDGLDWVKWQFYRVVGGIAKLIDDTGEVNTYTLQYTADNMQNGNIYRIVCTIQTESGIQHSAISEFFVSYSLPKIEGFFEFDCTDKASNLLTWSEIYENTGNNIQGVSNDDNYSYSNDCLNLAGGSTVIWVTKNDGSLDIPVDWTFAYKAKIALDFSKTNHKVVGNDVCGYITATKISPNEELFIVGLNSETDLVGVYRFNNGEPIFLYNIEILPHEKGDNFGFLYSDVDSITFSPDGKLLLVNSAQNGYWLDTRYSEIDYFSSLFAVNGTTITYIGQLKINGVKIGTRCNVATFSPDGKLLIVGRGDTKNTSFGGAASLFSVNGTEVEYLKEISKGGEAITNDIFTATFSPDGKLLMLGGGLMGSNVTRNASAYSVNGSEFTYLGELKNAEGDSVYGMNAAEFTPDGKYLIVVPYQDDICLYKVEGTNFVLQPFTCDTYVQGVAISPDGGTVVLKYYYTDGSRLDFYSFDNGTLTFIGKAFESFDDYRIYGEYFTKSGNNFVLYGNENYNGFYNILTLNEQRRNLINTSEFSVSILNELVVKTKDDYEIRFGAGLSPYAWLVDEYNADILLYVNKNKIGYVCGGMGQSYDIESSIYTQSAITSVILLGEQTCEWVYATNETADIQGDFSPVWDNRTQFLTHFEQRTLQAGQLNVAENKMDIYRENVETGKLEKLYSAPKEITQIRDFGWITGEKYYYTGYALLDNAYTSANPFTETPVCRNQPYYLLLETTQDEEYPDVYHVVNYWRFGNNISAGSVSNNNTPNFLTNFTKYRLKQPVSRMGKSGTLTALLSNVIGGEYKDTATQMEDLYNISASENTFFLKDMKGNLYMVAVSNPITQTINTKSFVQEVTVSIPWEEVGSTEGISIIQTPNDPNWVGNNDDLAKVAFSVDNATGMLSVEYPDGYSVTQFALNGERLVATTKGESQAPKLSLQNGSVKLKTEK